MKIAINFPAGENASFVVQQGNETASAEIARWGEAHDVILAESGRINATPIDAAQTGFPSIQQVDGKFTLDLTSDYAVPSSVFTTPQGRIVKAEVEPAYQHRGWGPGEHYYLPVDANNVTVIEPGENHRKVYITWRTSGHTAETIAAAEGIAASAVTNSWLEAQTKYGSEQFPLEQSLGRSFFTSLTQNNTSSHWLLLERGGEYTISVNAPVSAKGESAIHPLVIGAWGNGAKPIVSRPSKSNRPGRYIVWRDLTAVDGFSNINDHWQLYESCDALGYSMNFDIQSGPGSITIRNCRLYDAHLDVPGNNAQNWSGLGSHISALYTSKVAHVLMDGCHMSHGGWAEGYDPSGKGPIGTPHPPSMYSHNWYAQQDTYDATIRDSLSDRPASQGFMMRGGVSLYDTVSISAGVGINTQGGVYSGTPPEGNYSLISDFLITIATPERVAAWQGAANWARNQIAQAVWVGGIIAHGHDVTTSASYVEGGGPWESINGDSEAWFKHEYDDTIVANWGPLADQRLPITPAQALAVNLVAYFRQKTGNPNGTLTEFYAWARTQTPRTLTRDILRYFQSGFGIARAIRTTAQEIVFRPWVRGDGFRWDNRRNWMTGDIPGSVVGDSVDLYGNFVRFGNHTTTLTGLKLKGGTLDVVSGRLTTKLTGPGKVMVRNCGQLFTNSTALTGIPLGISGGRLNLTATTLTTLDNLTVYGRSEVLLPKNGRLPADKTMTIEGGLPKVGFDGTGTATFEQLGTLSIKSALALQHTLYAGGGTAWSYALQGKREQLAAGSALIADVERRNDSNTTITLHDWAGIPTVGEVFQGFAVNAISASLPTIRSFRSGMNGTVDPTVTPTWKAIGPLHLDLTGMAAITGHKLIDMPITGTFSGLTVTGLDPALDATVTVTASGVTLTLAAGTGQAVLR